MEIFIIVLLLIIGILFTSIKIVKEHENGVVFTLGQYSHTTSAGLKIAIPFVQTIKIVDMREQKDETDNKNITTQDGTTINVSATVSYKIINPEQAINHVKDYHQASKAAVEKALKNHLEQFDQDEIYETRHDKKEEIKQSVSSETAQWGVEITDLDINFRA